MCKKHFNVSYTFDSDSVERLGEVVINGAKY